MADRAAAPPPALRQLASARLGVPEETLTIEPLAAGPSTSNEMFLLRAGGQEWVLRRPPKVGNAPSAHDVLREFRLLQALDQTDVPHATSVAACEDEEVFERPFFLMERVVGFCPRVPLQPPFDHDEAATHRLGLGLVDAIAAVSRVDWRAIGLEGFGRPDGFLDRQVDRWLGQLERGRSRELDHLDEVVEWLRTNIPAEREIGLMHGDYSFFNTLFAPDASGQVAAVVDWETATIGDPLLDLGWLVGQWSTPGATELLTGAVTGAPGIPSRAELLERYRQVSGREVTHIRYYIALALFRHACILEGAYHRFVQGTSSHAAEHEQFGRLVPALLERAAATAAGTWAPELTPL
jgi:aminoglycoside phosphotransferase (APT) family kinase protein